jgi:hypothetical protein
MRNAVAQGQLWSIGFEIEAAELGDISGTRARLSMPD